MKLSIGMEQQLELIKQLSHSDRGRVKWVLEHPDGKVKGAFSARAAAAQWSDLE